MALQKIQTGLDALKKRIVTEGITDKAGNVLMSPSIAADSLNRALTAANLPTYQAPTIPPGTLTPSITPINNTNSDTMPSWMSNYLNAPGPVNPQSSTQQATNQTAVDTTNANANAKQQALIDAQGELAGYNAQLQGIVNETTQAGLKLREEGISAGAIQGRNISNEREAAIRSLPIQSLALIAQSKVAMAQQQYTLAEQKQQQAEEKLSQTFEIQQKYQDSLFEYQQSLRGAVFNYASDTQKQQLQAQQLEDERAYNDKKDLTNYARDLATTALQNGQGSLFTQISQLDPSSKTYAQDVARLAGKIQALASVRGDNELTTAQMNTTINSIANSFDNEPIVKNYNIAQEGYQTLNTIGVNTSSPADDIAFIYAFAKIMDPNSVVREGEYNTIQKYAQTWADNFGFTAKRIFSNTNFLSSDAKQKMLNALTPRINTLTTQYKNLQGEYNRRIDEIKAGGFNTISDYSTDGNNYTQKLDEIYNQQNVQETPEETQQQEKRDVINPFKSLWNWLTTPFAK